MYFKIVNVFRAGVGGGTRDKTPREVGTTDLWLSAALPGLLLAQCHAQWDGLAPVFQ
jgi:hypothetical protein